VLNAKYCWKGHGRRRTTRQSFPFQCFLSKAGGADVSIHTLGAVLSASSANPLGAWRSKALTAERAEKGRKVREEKHSPPPQPWYSRRPRRSETQLNYRCWVGSNGSGSITYFAVFSMAFSAKGAIIAYPALFGCRPSCARSRFSKPLSSIIGLK
jgi:hypothetical protein